MQLHKPVIIMTKCAFQKTSDLFCSHSCLSHLAGEVSRLIILHLLGPTHRHYSVSASASPDGVLCMLHKQM